MTIYVLQGNYGQGWEDLTAETTEGGINARLIEYGAAEGGRYRIVEQEEHEFTERYERGYGNSPDRRWMECTYCPVTYRPDIGEAAPDTPCEGERD